MADLAFTDINIRIEKDLLYAVIRHYLIVLKDGVILPEYLTLESKINSRLY